MRRFLVFLMLVFSSFLFISCGGQKTPSQGAPSSAAVPGALDFGNASATPKTGNGREGRFRVVFTRKPGGAQASTIGLLINDRQNGENACYAFRSVVMNASMLVLDSGIGSTPISDAPSVGNHQCELLSDTKSSLTDTEVVAEFHIRFRPEFRGPKHLWAIGQDDQGRGAEFQTVGEWTVE
jgi:hypothetical protein